MTLTPHNRLYNAGGGNVFPYPTGYSALMESGYSSTGAPATNATIALGWKPTKATSAPLIDMTGHYAMTIRKVSSTITVWKGGTELDTYGGAVGSTYAELVNNVLTYYGGAEEGYYSRLVVVEDSLTYSSFWEASDLVTGLWIPISLSGLTLHTLLDFSNALDLGDDSSGNGNDWTISGTQTEDTPTNNHCVLNPDIGPSNSTQWAGNATSGNTEFDVSTTPTVANLICGSMAGRSGAFYWEVTANDATSGDAFIGTCNIDECTVLDSTMYASGVQYRSNGKKCIGGVNTAYGDAYVSGDIIGVAVDVDGGTVEFFKNNVSQGVINQSVATACPIVSCAPSTNNNMAFNNGAQGFTYTPPTGYLALSAANLTDPTVLKSEEHVYIALFTAPASASQNITLPWNAEANDWGMVLKNRDTSESWKYISTVVGLGYVVEGTNTTSARASLSTAVIVSGTTVTLPDDLLTDSNDYLVEFYRVGAGFSIETYTGTGAAHAESHGNVGTPFFGLWMPNDTTARNHPVYSNAVGATKYGLRNSTAAFATSSAYFNDTATTSTQFTVGTSTDVNASGGEYQVWLWSESDVYSEVDYTGNAEVSGDGPFSNEGGKIKAIPFCKNSSGVYDWFNYDAERNQLNGIDLELNPNLSNAESTNEKFDFTSQGLKVVSSAAEINGGGNIIIGLAVLESTNKYANAF